MSETTITPFSPALPGHRGRLRRPARFRSLRLGDITVTHLPDGSVPLRPRRWLPETTDEVWAAHPEYLDDQGNLAAGIGALLVERHGRAILVDAGFGPGVLTPSPDAPILEVHGGALPHSLAVAGRDPATIEAVAVTHLHPDHIGWLWKPVPGTGTDAFPNARYLVAEPEWAHRDRQAERDTPPEALARMAPRVTTVADGEEIFPGVRVWLTDGHTDGHATYVIDPGDGGERLIAFGDALHSPLQIDHPEWSAAPDTDPARSAEVRRRLVAELATPGTIGYGTHFADVVFGRVVPGAGPAWRPLP